MGCRKKTDTTICLYILHGVVAEGPFYHSVNSECRYYAGCTNSLNRALTKTNSWTMAGAGLLPGVVVQLLRLYVLWGPGNYEKCKMFRMIHIIMMSLDKFRFVAQVATLGNFFY